MQDAGSADSSKIREPQGRAVSMNFRAVQHVWFVAVVALCEVHDIALYLCEVHDITLYLIKL